MKPIFALSSLALVAALLAGIASLRASEVEVGDFELTVPRTGATLKVFYAKSANYDPEWPISMVFHGMKRNADEYRDGWIDLAEEHGLYVVVPLFSEEDYPGTNGYNLGKVFNSEDDLTKRDWQYSSYLIPEDVYQHIKDERGETNASGYLAFGHSAGSQFLHRKIAFAPDDRLWLAIAANAGWYTFPEVEARWPYGFGGTGLDLADLKGLASSHMLVLLGDADVDPMHRSLRRTEEAMVQGLHRYERGHRYFEAGKALADQLGVEFGWELETVPGVAHEGEKMAPAAARAMVAFVEDLGAKGR